MRQEGIVPLIREVGVVDGEPVNVASMEGRLATESTEGHGRERTTGGMVSPVARPGDGSGPEGGVYREGREDREGESRFTKECTDE